MCSSFRPGQCATRAFGCPVCSLHVTLIGSLRRLIKVYAARTASARSRTRIQHRTRTPSVCNTLFYYTELMSRPPLIVPTCTALTGHTNPSVRLHLRNPPLRPSSSQAPRTSPPVRDRVVGGPQGTLLGPALSGHHALRRAHSGLASTGRSPNWAHAYVRRTAPPRSRPPVPAHAGSRAFHSTSQIDVLYANLSAKVCHDESPVCGPALCANVRAPLAAFLWFMVSARGRREMPSHGRPRHRMHTSYIEDRPSAQSPCTQMAPSDMFKPAPRRERSLVTYTVHAVLDSLAASAAQAPSRLASVRALALRARCVTSQPDLFPNPSSLTPAGRDRANLQRAETRSGTRTPFPSSTSGTTARGAHAYVGTDGRPLCMQQGRLGIASRVWPCY